MLTQALGWRATQLFLAVYAALVLLLILFCSPETLEIHPPPLPRDAEKAAAEAMKPNREKGFNPSCLSVADQNGNILASTKHVTEVKMTILNPFPAGLTSASLRWRPPFYLRPSPLPLWGSTPSTPRILSLQPLTPSLASV